MQVVQCIKPTIHKPIKGIQLVSITRFANSLALLRGAL